MASAKREVNAKIYDKKYYLEINEGGALVKQNNALTPRLEYVFSLANIRKKDVVLDVGCGSGEICFNALKKAKRVIGIDYSQDAIFLSNAKKKKLSVAEKKKISFYVGDATKLSTVSIKGVTKVILTDIVEHLYPEQLDALFQEIKKVTAKSATLYIHTTPNLEFYQYGYPIIRFFYPLLRRIPPIKDLLWTKPNWRNRMTLPKDPEEGSHNKLGHVNEQTPKRLKKTLEKNGYDAKIHVVPFLRTTQGITLKTILSVLSLPILRKFFGAEIIAIAKKK